MSDGAWFVSAAAAVVASFTYPGPYFSPGDGTAVVGAAVVSSAVVAAAVVSAGAAAVVSPAASEDAADASADADSVAATVPEVLRLMVAAFPV